MIALENDNKNKEMHQKFLDLWKDKDVYAYVKSQDNRWHFEKDKKYKKLTLCKTILRVSLDLNYRDARRKRSAMYQISNNEIVLGNVNKIP